MPERKPGTISGKDLSTRGGAASDPALSPGFKRKGITMSEKKCSCGCGCDASKTPDYRIPVAGEEMTLAELPVGMTATIVKVMPKARGRKKFADVGLVPGTELLMEAHAPFGGLIRVKIMETSMALHSSDAANIVLKKEA